MSQLERSRLSLDIRRLNRPRSPRMGAAEPVRQVGAGVQRSVTVNPAFAQLASLLVGAGQVAGQVGAMAEAKRRILASERIQNERDAEKRQRAVDRAMAEAETLLEGQAVENAREFLALTVPNIRAGTTTPEGASVVDYVDYVIDSQTKGFDDIYVKAWRRTVGPTMLRELTEQQLKVAEKVKGINLEQALKSADAADDLDRPLAAVMSIDPDIDEAAAAQALGERMAEHAISTQQWDRFEYAVSFMREHNGSELTIEQLRDNRDQTEMAIERLEKARVRAEEGAVAKEAQQAKEEADNRVAGLIIAGRFGDAKSAANKLATSDAHRLSMLNKIGEHEDRLDQKTEAETIEQTTNAVDANILAGKFDEADKFIDLVAPPPTAARSLHLRVQQARAAAEREQELSTQDRQARWYENTQLHIDNGDITDIDALAKDLNRRRNLPADHPQHITHNQQETLLRQFTVKQQTSQLERDIASVLTTGDGTLSSRHEETVHNMLTEDGSPIRLFQNGTFTDEAGAATAVFDRLGIFPRATAELLLKNVYDGNQGAFELARTMSLAPNITFKNKIRDVADATGRSAAVRTIFEIAERGIQDPAKIQGMLQNAIKADEARLAKGPLEKNTDARNRILAGAGYESHIQARESFLEHLQLKIPHAQTPWWPAPALSPGASSAIDLIDQTLDDRFFLLDVVQGLSGPELATRAFDETAEIVSERMSFVRFNGEVMPVVMPSDQPRVNAWKPGFEREAMAAISARMHATDRNAEKLPGYVRTAYGHFDPFGIIPGPNLPQIPLPEFLGGLDEETELAFRESMKKPKLRKGFRFEDITHWEPIRRAMVDEDGKPELDATGRQVEVVGWVPHDIDGRITDEANGLVVYVPSKKLADTHAAYMESLRKKGPVSKPEKHWFFKMYDYLPVLSHP